MMTAPYDTHDLEVWNLFLRVHTQLVPRLQAGMEEEQGLPLPWFDVLLQLSFSPGQCLRMTDLGHGLLLTRSGLTRRIDRMEVAGLVERSACEGDARGVLVSLTADGHARLERSKPGHLARIRQLFTQHIEQAESQAMLRAFKRILGDIALDTNTEDNDP